MIVFHKDTQHNMVVTMTVDAPDAEIHYTLDGSVPTMDSPKYEIPFSINRAQTVSALAFRDGKPVGDVRTKRW
jgi:hexosaminidase